MTPVTRRRAAAGDASSSAPQARKRRGDAVILQEEKEEECCVCLGPLSSKRAATLRPCGHKYHNSCLRHWFETRDCRKSQTCALCRGEAAAIIDHTGTYAPPTFPYGDTGEPSKGVLIYYYQPSNLQQLLQQTESGLARCEEDMKAARDEGRLEEYIEDIQEEVAQLQARRANLQQLLDEWQRDAWEEQGVGQWLPLFLRTPVGEDGNQDARAALELLNRAVTAIMERMHERNAAPIERSWDAIQMMLAALRERLATIEEEHGLDDTQDRGIQTDEDAVGPRRSARIAERMARGAPPRQ